jgi:hypothetical protein
MKAHVAAALGGWAAGAPQGEAFVGVIVVGLNASERTAIALMQEALKRPQ